MIITSQRYRSLSLIRPAEKPSTGLLFSSVSCLLSSSADRGSVISQLMQQRGGGWVGEVDSGQAGNKVEVSSALVEGAE